MKSLRYNLVTLVISIVIAATVSSFAQTLIPPSDTSPVAPVANPCPRLKAGSVVEDPPALYSHDGVLNVRFSYEQTTDAQGRLLHCFMTPEGLEAPTLHVHPGDTLNITVTNNTPPSPLGEVFNTPNCGDSQVEFTPPANGIDSVGSSMNIHYHGTVVSPRCGGDNVTKTLINSGSTFQYSFVFPDDHPTGLYWYHPHIHGLAERDSLGGATGALVVEGIQNVQPEVRSLRQRVLVIRDQPQLKGLAEGPGNCGNGVPFQDLSLNYVPINSFLQQDGLVTFTPAVLTMAPGKTQFWRVVNAAADSLLDLRVVYDGVPQTLQIVAIDGVPVNSQDGTQPGGLTPVQHFQLPTASRVEFLIQPPSPSVKVAQLLTNNINTGPLGDCDPTRPIANIVLARDQSPDAHETEDTLRDSTPSQRFAGLDDAPVSVTRILEFSENNSNEFFITQVSPVAAQPKVFNPNNPPAIVTVQGSVEKWIIRNVAQETHDFHIHQVHFKVLSQDNFEINGNQPEPAVNGQFLDMINIPFWDNVKNPNGPAPQVELLMDFRAIDVGDFVFHCHILNHEDLGMMAIIRVLPKQP
jgi:FtsP/CotA-like multicopper oxidase with cupredoxin domain